MGKNEHIYNGNAELFTQRPKEDVSTQGKVKEKRLEPEKENKAT